MTFVTIVIKNTLKVIGALRINYFTLIIKRRNKMIKKCKKRGYMPGTNLEERINESNNIMYGIGSNYHLFNTIGLLHYY